ncbi:MAG: hypothetical protein ACD_71C00017G0004 [uncultured bacterium (gcode 4)]|uniref:Uncharacterized protein n=1 Tax=uncultured bacterium (gcode 4) TaxID=1234023 RepID=K1Z5H9_9BACT|nr:MAG: hypothetical protein ACD_71C00017G0004 [uncultured bacterium (gcode 4)]
MMLWQTIKGQFTTLCSPEQFTLISKLERRVWANKLPLTVF